MPTQTLAVLTPVNRQPGQENHRNRFRHVPADPSHRRPPLHRGCRKRVKTDHTSAMTGHERAGCPFGVISQSATAQVGIKAQFATIKTGDIVIIPDRTRCAVSAHASVTKGDGSEKSRSSRSLGVTGLSSTAKNSCQAASSRMNRRRSASTSRACARVAVTVKLVRSVPSTSAARRMSAFCSEVRRTATRSVLVATSELCAYRAYRSIQAHAPHRPTVPTVGATGGGQLQAEKSDVPAGVLGAVPTT